MAEIQRYRSDVYGLLSKYPSGRAVLYADHLADKKAALETKDAEILGDLNRREIAHGKELTAALAAQAEEHLCRRKSDDADWGDRFIALSREHAKELAEKEARHAKTFRRLVEERDDADLRADRFAKELADARGEGEPALMYFDHPLLIGEQCVIHRDFKPIMDRLCGHASECCVSLFVTHSMRQLDQQLVGAIVKAAKRSNHHAGSAVDLNVMWDQTLYTSTKMREAFDDFPDEHPVLRFIEGVRADPLLRWGGDWQRKDEVHFDDDLVRRDPDEWARRVGELNDV